MTTDRRMLKLIRGHVTCYTQPLMTTISKISDRWDRFLWNRLGFVDTSHIRTYFAQKAGLFLPLRLKVFCAACRAGHEAYHSPRFWCGHAHKHAHIKDNLWVDQGVADDIRTLLAAGVETFTSCENSGAFQKFNGKRIIVIVDHEQVDAALELLEEYELGSKWENGARLVAPPVYTRRHLRNVRHFYKSRAASETRSQKRKRLAATTTSD